MSKISIKGATTGTGVFTLESPATNTDRTLTIPDVDGSIVTADASGNVGIGTTSPSVPVSGVGLHLSDTSANTGIRFQDTAFANKDFTIRLDATDNALAIYHQNSASEKMRIDSSGNLLVGTTDTNPSNDSETTGAMVFNQAFGGTLMIRRSAGEPLFLNRTTTDGGIAVFRKDGTTVGSIGSASVGKLYIGSPDGSGGFLRFESNQISPCSSSGGVRDNIIDLGKPESRFDDIYATNGTIQTSDVNEKQDIEALSEAEARVAVACKGLLRKFRWKDSVAEKGDEARIHFGIIAQDLQAAFAAEGLDAGRYAMFISSTWTDEETGEERTRLGVRYPELLAFIIGAL